MADDHFTPIADPLCASPPRGIMQRPAMIRPNKLNTLRLMHDPKVVEKDRWFDTSADMPPVRAGNEAAYLIRGGETFDAMVEAIRLAGMSSDMSGLTHRGCVYLLGWSFDHKFTLPVDGGVTMETLLNDVSAKGVEVRAMLWANSKGSGEPVTTPQVKFINGLPTGRAIMDQKTSILVSVPLDTIPQTLFVTRNGSHHQKVLVTNGAKGLIAFCGGVDIFVDRVDDFGHKGDDGTPLPICGLHDVHCRIRGPAAHDLLTLFADRWHDYLGYDDGDRDRDAYQPSPPNPAKDALGAEHTSRPDAVGNQYVQIGYTFPRDLYQFAPTGRRSARKAILKAIDSARDFIYMEDQYLLNLDAADALAAVLARPTFRHLIIVIPDDNAIDEEFLGQASFHRAKFVKRLLSGAGKEKAHIFCADRYTHAKMYIVDDRLAIIGSANCNRRGWEHDSEVVATIFDESSDEVPAWHFAHRLRVRLWADHLNIGQQANAPLPMPWDPNGAVRPLRPFNDDGEFSELADGIASAAHWLKRPPKARVREYVPMDHHGATANQVLAESMDRKIGSPDPSWPKTAQTVREYLRLHAVGYVKNHPGSAQVVWDNVIDPPSP